MTEPCIEWDGPKNDWGYGTLMVDHKKQYAHRVAYAKANGLSMDAMVGKVVRHRCDNPACVNPKHLVIGSHDDNMKDMTARGRSQHGSSHSSAKLTEAAVSEIRRRHAGGESIVSLAADFSVAWVTVSRVVKGLLWKHVPMSASKEGA